MPDITITNRVSDSSDPSDPENPAPPSMPEDTKVGIEPVGGLAVVVINLYMLTLSVVLLYTMFAFNDPHANSMRGYANLTYFGVNFKLSVTYMTFMLAILSGALGGQAYALKSFNWYSGNRTLHWSWVPRYIVAPFQGAVMGFVFHIIVNSGLQGGQTGSAAPNSYLTMGISLLVGLFSEQALEKLHQIATAFFADTPIGRDRMAHVNAPGTPPAPALPPTNRNSSGKKRGSDQPVDPIHEIATERPLRRPIRHISSNPEVDPGKSPEMSSSNDPQSVQAVVSMKLDLPKDAQVDNANDSINAP